jgi:anaerobic selenocysteine-containing dehydrogenase
MGKALVFGDLNDPGSDIAKSLDRPGIKVLNPELGTFPAVYYAYNGDGGTAPLNEMEIKKGHPVTKVVRGQTVPENETTGTLINTSDAMCPSECGISVLVEDGVAKKIYGNPASLINNGTLCAKGASGLQLTYSPHRIKTPLIRDGDRGGDKWKEISWEEAADYIAGKLTSIKQKYGPESVFLDCGDVTDREAYYRLFHAFGTPNTYNHGSICDPNRRWGQGIITGDERPLPDIQRPVLIRNDDGETVLKTDHEIRLLLNIGVNPLVATRFNYMSSGIPAAREENSCMYIVVDPSHTNSSAHSDLWLPIIPGTDAALLAAMLYFIITIDSPDTDSKRYIDHDFLKQYTIGWPEFKEAFLRQSKEIDPSNNLHYFSTEWAADRTGIAPDDIEKIAHLFGTTKPAAIEIGMHGTAHHTNGDVTSIVMTVLCLITGNIDIPGGLVFIESQKPLKGTRTIGKEFLDKTVIREIDGNDVTGSLSELQKDSYGDYPAAWKGVVADIPQKIREGVLLKHGCFKDYRYPVKAFITRAGNPMITAGRTGDWVDAVTGQNSNGDYDLELMVFIDTHITTTGKYADIILPEAGYLERMGLSDVYTMSPEIAIRDQVIKPLHASKTPYEIMIALSEELIRKGDPDLIPGDFTKYRNEEEFINELLEDTPGFYNIGAPLPYPDLPEGCLITGTPDNPRALWGRSVIKKGELLTVDWLRKHNGVAVWPASYYRYKKANGSPSGFYPKTASGKFEFTFGYLERINKKLGLNFPTTFYWADCKWNPKNVAFKEISREYPFQLISGRVHSAMTMTSVCPYIAETKTECMQPLNDEFKYTMPQLDLPFNEQGLEENRETAFKPGSTSIPVFAINHKDGEQLALRTGDSIALENPAKNRINGKVFLTDEIMPGVIKTAFGPGGQHSSGTGFLGGTSAYTPSINDLFDPDNLSPFTGMPGFGDIMVRIMKDV